MCSGSKYEKSLRKMRFETRNSFSRNVIPAHSRSWIALRFTTWSGWELPRLHRGMRRVNVPPIVAATTIAGRRRLSSCAPTNSYTPSGDWERKHKELHLNSMIPSLSVISLLVHCQTDDPLSGHMLNISLELPHLVVKMAWQKINSECQN